MDRMTETEARELLEYIYTISPRTCSWDRPISGSLSTKIPILINFTRKPAAPIRYTAGGICLKIIPIALTKSMIQPLTFPFPFPFLFSPSL